MNNKVIYTSSNDFNIIKEDLTRNNKIFWVEIDGRNISNLSEYFFSISNLCIFPIPARSWAGYNDWKTDFTWIREDAIVIVINNFGCFLRSDLSSKVKVVEKFQNSILPWWEEDVMDHVVDGKTKKFTVYLVD